MKFSLINISKQVGDKVTGNWIQNHIGTLETATAKAIEYENSQPIMVAVVDEVPSPVPMLTLWEDRQRLDRIAEPLDAASYAERHDRWSTPAS